MTAIEGALAVVTTTYLAVMAAGLPQVKALMRGRTIRPRLRPLPSARVAAGTPSSVTRAAVCGICRMAVDALQHWPPGRVCQTGRRTINELRAKMAEMSFCRAASFAQRLVPGLSAGPPVAGVAGGAMSQFSSGGVSVSTGLRQSCASCRFSTTSRVDGTTVGHGIFWIDEVRTTL